MKKLEIGEKKISKLSKRRGGRYVRTYKHHELPDDSKVNCKAQMVRFFVAEPAHRVQVLDLTLMFEFSLNSFRFFDDARSVGENVSIDYEDACDDLINLNMM